MAQQHFKRGSFSASICRKPWSRATATAAIMLASASAAHAQTYVYGGGTTGQWGVPGTWLNENFEPTNDVPNSVDALAVIAKVANIEINGVYTIGTLSAGIAAGGSITTPTLPTSFDPTKGLTFATSAGIPAVIVNANTNLFYYNALFGNQGIEKRGVGRFTMRFNSINQTYTGDVRITNGTFGIEKDGSLGASTNQIFLGTTGTGTFAELLAEPGSNSGDFSIDAGRTINLIGTGAQLAASDRRIRWNVGNTITDNGLGLGFTKSGAGIIALTGTNNYTGVTGVSNGALLMVNTTSIPGWNTPGRVNVSANGHLAARLGDVSLADFDTLRANATYAPPAAGAIPTYFVGFDTSASAGTVVHPGFTNAEPYGLSKIGSGVLELTGTNNYAGNTAIWSGTLQLAAGASLPNGKALQFLAGARSAAELPQLDLGGSTLGITGLGVLDGNTVVARNGTINFTPSAQYVLPTSNNTKVDFSGLTGFNFDSTQAGESNFVIQPSTAANNTVVEMLLAKSGAGTNKLVVNNLQVGAASGASANSGHEGRLRLGQSNEIFANSVTLGGFNGSGLVTFQAGMTNATLKLRAQDGTSALATLRIGETSSGIRTGEGKFDTTGGTIDIVATNMSIGRHIAGSTNNDSSFFTMTAGTLDVATLVMSEKVNTGTPQLNSALNVGGGTATIGSIVMGRSTAGTGTGTPPTTPQLKPTLNLTGGTLRAGNISPDNGASAAAFDATTSNRVINLNGGTLANLNATTDLLVSGVADNDANAATTGNLVKVIVGTTGTSNVQADVDRRITFSNTVAVSGDGILRKTGNGGLQINGSLAAALSVDAGAVQISNGTVPASGLNINATLVIDYAAETALPAVQTAIAAGYNGGAWDGVGYTSTAAAISTAPKHALGFAETAALFGTGPTTVNGLEVDNTAVIVKYVLRGDSNLSGSVNFADLVALAQAYNQSGTTWTRGDFNYDGTTNFADLVALAQNYNQVQPADVAALGVSFAEDWALAQTMVPEPTTLLAAAAGVVGLVRRRRSMTNV